MTFTRNFIASAAIAIAFSSAPATAGNEEPQVEISYADLNLESKAGQDTLEFRIRSAIQEVCGGPAQPNIAFGRPVRKCISKATAEGMKAHQMAVASYKTQRLALRDRKVRFAIR